MEEHIAGVGWTLDSNTGTVTIPPNPDNTVEATVVRESIGLPRMITLSFMLNASNVTFRISKTDLACSASSIIYTIRVHSWAFDYVMNLCHSLW